MKFTAYNLNTGRVSRHDSTVELHAPGMPAAYLPAADRVRQIITRRHPDGIKPESDNLLLDCHQAGPDYWTITAAQLRPLANSSKEWQTDRPLLVGLILCGEYSSENRIPQKSAEAMARTAGIVPKLDCGGIRTPALILAVPADSATIPYEILERSVGLLSSLAAAIIHPSA